MANGKESVNFETFIILKSCIPSQLETWNLEFGTLNLNLKFSYLAGPLTE
jgi:hypothetical protein